mmetsp:Transcript_57961/g.161762  ORF Transcript_57961/g.161762 Transcript_57961/m.161762 type:complete len:291 (-) Transcript_57961:220-1092(-)
MASYVGAVTSFNFGKEGQAGYGFILCDQVQGEIYFQRKHLPEDVKNFGYNGVIKGRTVSFELVRNTASGKPQGINIQLLPQPGEPVLGKIRSYSQRNRYGFITSPHVHEDCYFQQRELPESMQDVDGKRLEGQTVQFDVVIKPDGKPWASNVKLHKMIMVAGKDPKAMSGGVNAMGMKAMLMKMLQGKRPASAIEAAPAKVVKKPRTTAQPMGMPSSKGEGQTKVGIVKSFNPTKGFGFIGCPGVPQGDVYFQRVALAAGTPHELTGRQVKFQLTFTPEGRPQGKNVALA